jgi:hypothetical protein
MSDMSPLGRLILTVLLWGVRFAAGAIAIILAIMVWQKWFSAAAVEPSRQDYIFLAILVGLLIGAVLFARSVTRELHK